MGVVLLCTFAFRLDKDPLTGQDLALDAKDRAALNDLSLEAPTLRTRPISPQGWAAKVARTPGLAGQTAAKGD